MTRPQYVRACASAPLVSAKMARQWAEDAAAVASFAERQGFTRQAQEMRDFRDQMLALLEGQRQVAG